ncbi:MAG: hypothetical protein ACP5XB_10855, partial [Isosphaeraceae bacterium]
MQMLTSRTREERYQTLSSGRLDMKGKAPGQIPAPQPPIPPPPSYWSATRRPLPSLSLVAPLMLAYELGVLWRGGTASTSVRTGADAWMRHALAAVGLTDQWLPPLVLVVILLGWQVANP